MNSILKRIIKVFAYLAGGIVILLAIAVGLFRLFLPRLPEYQEDIKGWASAAIGMQVDFSGMDARWGLSGPEIEFYNAELIALDTMARVIAVDQVSVGVVGPIEHLMHGRKGTPQQVYDEEAATCPALLQIVSGVTSVAPRRRKKRWGNV